MTDATPIRCTDPATIRGITNLLAAGRLIVREDLKAIRYTVFETEHPDATVQTPVPDFIDIDVSVEDHHFDELQTVRVFYDVGGAGHVSREVQFNFRVIVAPLVRIDNGEKTVIYPFAVRGKYYRVVIAFDFNDPTIAPFTHSEVIQAL